MCVAVIFTFDVRSGDEILAKSHKDVEIWRFNKHVINWKEF